MDEHSIDIYITTIFSQKKKIIYIATKTKQKKIFYIHFHTLTIPLDAKEFDVVML